MARTGQLFINRELSWLEFNQRVLGEARDPAVPLLDRLKFLAITSSNLDEFFMVRVGGLHILKDEGHRKKDPAGLTPAAQLEQITRYTRKMVVDQYAGLMKELEPALREAGLRRRMADELDAGQLAYVERLFDDLIYPVLTPQAIDPDKPFPTLPALTIHLAVRLAPKSETESAPRMAVVAVPRNITRFLTVPSGPGYEYVCIEEVIRHFIDRLFPGVPVEEVAAFRVTRNADVQVSEDEAPDLLAGMEEVLVERKHSFCVRLEVQSSASARMLEYLQNVLRVDPRHLFRVPDMLDLSALMGLSNMTGFEEYKYEPWPPQWAPDLQPPESMFDILAKRDVLLVHPYDSFEPVLRLIDEAADDPGVMAIKQILYRTSAKSPVVAALARAAQKGKQVTVIVELKARFDEARNIEWARELERAGVQVIYGVRGLKTHAKVLIIIRRETAGIRRYIHFGTGNYNEITAHVYSDISLMTSNEDYAADASAFFNTITGYAQPLSFRKIEAAPIGLRARVVQLIESETERQLQGQRGQIMAKLNSLVDPEVIRALYKASQAGVKVQLNVRGICCLRPGVKGVSENIEVVSIVDRFLEHSRLFYFHQDGDPLFFLSSADWMPRNLDRRIELLVPVDDAAARRRLLALFKTTFRDNVKAHQLMQDGSYKRLRPPSRARAVRSQEVFYREACEAVRAMQDDRLKVFKPHLPSAEASHA